MKLNNISIYLVVIGLLSTSVNLYAQKVVRYDLYVRDTLVNFTGKTKRAIAVNGQIPMPTLSFTQGDTAEIHVYNAVSYTHLRAHET
jgi:FtsP/CotA-like multicopper oxidase with cupredoxin domain